MKHLHNNQAGIAHVVIIIAVATVVGVVGFAGWRIMQNNKKDGGSGSTALSSSEAKQVAAECNKELNDKDLCKFFTSWSGAKKFATTSTDSTDGATTKSTVKVDGDNTYMKVEGEFAMEIITMGTTTYTKGGNYWWKQTTKPSSTTNATPTVSTDDYKFEEPSSNEPDPTQYKSLGKEACGNLTCLKYQVIDPTDTETSTQYLWFDDSQYLIRKMRTESKDGSVNEQVFSYDNISVTVPSPVKELAPNQYIMPGSSEPTTMPSFDGTN